jgi:Mn-containing catalase
MILRIDRAQTEMPRPSDPDPAGAARVQELMGGRFGEIDLSEAPRVNQVLRKAEATGARQIELDLTGRSSRLVARARSSACSS